MIANGAIMDLNCFLKFMILVMIILFVGFLAWIENKVANSNEVNNNTQREEVVQVSDEINLFFQQDDDNTISNGLSEYCACSFCGKLSKIITTCSRCKNAMYCSKECHVMHGRSWHRDECVDETVSTEDNEESSSHHVQCFLLEPGNEISKYSFNDDDDEKIYEGNVYYIEGGGENNVEPSKETSMRLHHGIVGNNDSCAVCGNPCSKKCSRCKAIKYCSQTCQHFDWRSGHKFQCFVTKKSSAQETTSNQEWPADENVIMPPNLDDVKDNGHSYDPLCLEFYPEENSNTKALILSYQEASNKVQEVEQQMRTLKEELKMIRNENISLQSKLNYWEIRAKYSADRLYSFKKENEHQLFILKHENELISNAEKQARQMVTNLSQRIHCLQIAVETGVAERKKQEEFTLALQNECAKAKREFQEQNKYVERLIRQKLDDATQFPMKVAEEAGKESGTRIISADESRHTSVEVSQTISLSRNPTLTRQCCTICLTSEKDLAFGCGHMTCRECGSKIRKCHICRKKIVNRIRLFPG